jgi:hypothetical protein
MQQNTPSDANSHAASQEIPYILQYLKVHNHVHKSLQLDSIMSQVNPVHILIH